MPADYIRMEGEGTAQDGDVTPSRLSTAAKARQRKNLGKSGTIAKEPPTDDTNKYADDDDYSFLAPVRINFF